MYIKFGWIVILLIINNESLADENDYYQLLGVNRDATVKEIRKAFKNLAVKLHPDKNKEDENADANFIRLTRAYEVLKDPESRKRYDIYGEQMSAEKFKKQYHSYSYYRDQFGIYDDDPIIVTLSKNDYEVNILDNSQAWFVNFYSPNCYHCHELAPTWRKLAQELEGVIRIGAVNCEDDYKLCLQLRIEAYPTLLYYEKEFHLYEGIKYTGDRTVEALEEFVVSKLDVNVLDVTSKNWDTFRTENSKWLLFLCAVDNSNCPEERTILKLSSSLESLVSVGIVKEEELCQRLSDEYKTKPIILLQAATLDASTSPLTMHTIKGSDTKELLQSILALLPNPQTVDEKDFQNIRSGLKNESEGEKPWLFCFYLGAATELNLQLKRLPPLIPDIDIGLIHCGKNSELCSSLHVVRYPTWGVLKVGGAFELHHGRDVLYDIANFAKDSVKSKNLHALCPPDFKRILADGTPWFIDWYAPWCPPCRKLLPELRKASQNFDSDKVQFGTIDCTSHRELCRSQGINSYPTSILYNNSQIQMFQGLPDSQTITEFLQDMMNPLIVSLDDSNFGLLMRKPKEEMWVVDFFAPWCGPCQKLGPQWRQLAKQVSAVSEIKVAQVDCVANSDLCDAQNVRSYPTIRLYPLGSKGLNSVAIYNGARDAVSIKRWLLSFLPTSVESFSASDLKEQVLTKRYMLPWIIDFYAPWCGHCVHFEPDFRTIAQRLEGKVRSAKLDCEKERVFCGQVLGITGYPTVRLYLSPSEFYPVQIGDVSYVLKQVKEVLDKKKHEYDHDEL